jgi:hypothetical protein
LGRSSFSANSSTIASSRCCTRRPRSGGCATPRRGRRSGRGRRGRAGPVVVGRRRGLRRVRAPRSPRRRTPDPWLRRRPPSARTVHEPGRLGGVVVPPTRQSGPRAAALPPLRGVVARRLQSSHPVLPARISVAVERPVQTRGLAASTRTASVTAARRATRTAVSSGRWASRRAAAAGAPARRRGRGDPRRRVGGRARRLPLGLGGPRGAGHGRGGSGQRVLRGGGAGRCPRGDAGGPARPAAGVTGGRAAPGCELGEPARAGAEGRGRPCGSTRRSPSSRPATTKARAGSGVVLGSEARELGSAGVGMVADAVGVLPDTVRRGRSKLDDPTPLPVGRSRVLAGGASAPSSTITTCPRRWTSWSNRTHAVIR